MTHTLYYPPADKNIQNRGKGNVTMPTIEKLVLHSTETREWPGYSATALGGHPTLTYNPWTHQWRQHLPINGSATALKDPSGTIVRENRDGVVQVEIVGYCDKVKYNVYGHAINKIDQRALNDLGDFVAWMHKEWGLILRAAEYGSHWPAYPGSINAVRMSGTEFDTFKGVCGHMHVSGNAHGDPGDINILAIMARANAVVNPPKPQPKPEPKPVTPTVEPTKPARPKREVKDAGDVWLWDGLDAPHPDTNQPAAKINWYWTGITYLQAIFKQNEQILKNQTEILKKLK